ncbi:MAG: SurA N-terminal domain-containing protein, partial [Thermoanaerobaculia bacterium]|nr:SurA N-terminal domain-containing protein [Thermoanaerobaculia bacterium]
MKKTILTLCLTLAAGSLSSAQIIEAVVVRVGDRIVTRSQYEKRLRDTFNEIAQTTPAEQIATKQAEARKRLTDELINELLIKDRADRIGIIVNEAEVKEAVTRLKQQYNISTDEQFDSSLKQSGMTRADMEQRLRDTLVTNKVFARELRNRAELEDRELRERYDREKDHYRLPERAHLREIVVLKPESGLALEMAKQRGTDVAAKVRAAGADFAKIATEFSEAGTKDRGGDLGEVRRGELLPDLDQAVFNAPTGSVIGPIETR